MQPAVSPSAGPARPPNLPDVAPHARLLAYLGLAPFVVGMLLVWFTRADAHYYSTLMLSAYAGAVIAFLGGIHWGVAFREAHPTRESFNWGVVPALVAWVAMVMPPYAGLVVQGAMLVACYLIDRKVYPRHHLNRWLTLRFRLSAVAALCCFLGAAGT